MRITDKVCVGKRVTDQNGFVHAPAIITRVGIQKYHADELRCEHALEGALNGISGLVDVFRPPETVFHPLTVDSFKNMPVTIGHPVDMVHPENARRVVGGHIGEDVCKTNQTDLGCTIHLHDCDTIDISKGIETSAGYDCPIVAEDGEYEGQKYRFRFNGPMIGNHLALVPRGRTGSKVLDNQTEMIMKLDTEALMQVTEEVGKVVGPAVQTAVAAAVAGLNIGDAVDTAVKSHFEKVAADAAAIESQRVLDEAAKKKTDEALAKQVELRAKLQPLLGDKYDATKTDHELMVLAVGDSVKSAASRSDEYLTDVIDQIVEDRKAGKESHKKADALGVKTISLIAFPEIRR